MANILVVDDELGIRELLSEILNDEGHTVELAENAAQARQFRPATVYVWDPFVRLFHWSLVTAVVLNQFVWEEGDTAHEWTGYTDLSSLGLGRCMPQ